MTRAKASTRQRLARLRAALLLTTVVVLAVAIAAFLNVSDTADTIRDRTTTAMLEVVSARAALAEANQAAIGSFDSPEAPLAGPGQDYQNRMAAASQSLARVAEFNQAGADGAGRLQVIEGLVTAYTASIGQADAHFRDDSTLLGITDMWYASRLLRADGGILPELQELQNDQRQALDEQVTPAFTTWLLALWLIAIVILLFLLAKTQVYLRRRFRRRLNLPLVTATVLVLGACTALVFTNAMHTRQGAVRDKADIAFTGWQARISADEVAGDRDLVRQLYRWCRPVSDCGRTVGVDQVDRQDPAARPDAKQLAARVKDVTDEAAAAAESGVLPYLIPGTLIGAAVLMLIGMYQRLREYQYE